MYGWLCPRCGTGNAPTVTQCPCNVAAQPLLPPMRQPFAPAAPPWSPGPFDPAYPTPAPFPWDRYDVWCGGSTSTDHLDVPIGRVH
jgi:hypothetical protein